MSRSAVAYTAASIYCALLIAAALWAGRRTHNAADFFVASRRMLPVAAAFSAAVNAVSVMLLLALITAAFAWGLAAMWIVIAMLAGILMNWIYVAPRLRTLAADQESLTVVQVLTADIGSRMQRLVSYSTTLILVSGTAYLVATQLNLATRMASSEFDLSLDEGVLWLAAVVVLQTMIGGIRSASLTASIQCLTLLAALLIADGAALQTIGGLSALREGMRSLGQPMVDWSAGRVTVLAATFVLGTLGIGLGNFGQPQILSRFMAVAPTVSGNRARLLSLLWAVVVLCAALVLGWSAKVLYGDSIIAENAWVVVVNRLLPSGLGTALIAMIIVTLVSTADSQLLVMSSSAVADLRIQRSEPSTAAARFLVLLSGVAALLLSIEWPSVLGRYLLVWNLLGATFGPVLLVRLSGKRIRPGSMLGAMWAGCLLTLLFYVLPSGPGEFLDRVLPFVAALGIALTGGERRRNPDRADRAEATVHDHIPI